MYTFDDNAFSDLHKDAFGFRPGENYWTWMGAASDDDKQKEWDFLIRTMHQRMKEEHEEEHVVGLPYGYIKKNYKM